MSPSVLVVVPTTGRTSLLRAVCSALGQTYPVDVVVVVDNPAAIDTVESMIGNLEVNVVRTSGHRGGSAARNLGAKFSGSDFIAYLDDDDWWEPTKIEYQIREICQLPPHPHILSATKMFFHRERAVTEIPAARYLEDTDAASYLVLRPAFRFGTNAIQTSGLLITRQLHDLVMWDEGLPKHQDWDYIARALRIPRVQFVWVSVALVHVQKDSNGSISKKADHTASMQWLEIHRNHMTRLAKADFACTHILRAALAERSMKGLLLALSVIARSGVPHPAALFVGLSGIRASRRAG